MSLAVSDKLSYSPGSIPSDRMIRELWVGRTKSSWLYPSLMSFLILRYVLNSFHETWMLVISITFFFIFPTHKMEHGDHMVPRLRELLKEQGVRGYSRKKKAKLIVML